MGTYLVTFFTILLVLLGAVLVHLWLGFHRSRRYRPYTKSDLKPGLPQLDDIIFE
ncbi:hypothetical protein KDK_36700 [Dictyobacter kobayashii]|uniref:Uncharacterized protein n=1 Tax=Dictyobacter kobayashii TaxID=2014872 RepID=A0A402ALJ0_9CHLR|nr:hypothetical protein KDK_36700 [Dictyobacter kobayashii]